MKITQAKITHKNQYEFTDQSLGR